MTQKTKRKILKALEETKNNNWEFGSLYYIYLRVWKKTHKDGNPVTYEEWVDNELEELRKSYRRYLQEAVIEDKGFDETATEDFWIWAEEEIKNPIW